KSAWSPAFRRFLRAVKRRAHRLVALKGSLCSFVARPPKGGTPSGAHFVGSSEKPLTRLTNVPVSNVSRKKSGCIWAKKSRPVGRRDENTLSIYLFTAAIQ